MMALNARERRLIAIALLVLVVFLVEALVVAPLLGGFAARADRRATLLDTYARNERLIDTLPGLRRRAREQDRALARFVIGAPAPSLAGDRLKERLRDAFGAAGGRVTGVQDVATTPSSVRAWVDGTMTLAQLEALLQQLQNTPPYLLLEGVRIAADRSLASGHLDLLDVRVEASIPFIPAAS